jgi:2-polyprenyl-3-methyl-5-hydroxy-6-metoxy-1,4-benzoquinol methylase
MTLSPITHNPSPHTHDEALIADPAAAWDAAAPAWDDFVETGLDYWRTEVHGPALLAACEDIRSLRVLDLGCGQGWFTRQLAMHGAGVIGVDFSTEQIANALRHEAAHPLGIQYRLLDAMQIGAHWPPDSFDLITACMALHDSPHTASILSACRQVLAPEGRVAFSIVHPVTAGPHTDWERSDDGGKGARRVDRYFEIGPYILNWTMARLTTHWSTPHWHRTLSDWSALISEAGFIIVRLDEPRPTPEQTARNPALAPAMRVPFFLIFTLGIVP